VEDVQHYFAQQNEINKALFFALGKEGGDSTIGFDRLQKIFESHRPKDFKVASATYPEEKHSSTELLCHYDGLRAIFKDWPMPRDDRGMQVGGIKGIERHFQELSERYGFAVSAEREINSYGYALLDGKKTDEAIRTFRRNVEMYPQSPNVYDSLAEALQANGKTAEALMNVQKAIDLAVKNDDSRLPGFKNHLEQLSSKK
jgi:tetratricopeptide (TPR) repeat protein